jgi:hypothetical protein
MLGKFLAVRMEYAHTIKAVRMFITEADYAESHGAELGRQFLGEGVDCGGDLFEAGGAVVDCVHGRDVGQQGLGCADVGGRLLPADVLLAGLEGHPEGSLAGAVL